jgi:ATP synthase alpha/beta chain, C terminal domain
MVDERTRKVIEHGRRIRAVLRQPQFTPLTLGEQVALLTAVRVCSTMSRWTAWMRSGPALVPGSFSIVRRQSHLTIGRRHSPRVCMTTS